MEETKKNGIVWILSIIIVLLIGLCALFAFDVITLNLGTNNSENEKEIVQEENENYIDVKTYEINGSEEEEEIIEKPEFNGIKVKVVTHGRTTSTSHDEFYVNGNKVPGTRMWIYKYSHFGNNYIIIESGDTSTCHITIYNIMTNSVEKDLYIIMDENVSYRYKSGSYSIYQNKIAFEAHACGGQCGEEEPQYYDLLAEIEYKDSTFGDLRIVNRY